MPLLLFSFNMKRLFIIIKNILVFANVFTYYLVIYCNANKKMA